MDRKRSCCGFVPTIDRPATAADALRSESDRAYDRKNPGGRVTNEEILEARRHQPNRPTMLEDVTHGDKYREAEEDEGLDAVPMLLLKGGSCGSLGLRKLRLMRAPLSRFPLALQLSSTASTLVGHSSTPSA